MPGEPALKLANAQVYLAGQQSHRDPAAAGPDQPDCLANLPGRFSARFQPGQQQVSEPGDPLFGGQWLQLRHGFPEVVRPHVVRRCHPVDQGPTSASRRRSAAPGKNETFTWSTLPWNRSHTACLRGPTTAVEGTSPRSQSLTSTGSPKQTGNETSPPPKSSTDTPARGSVAENTWKARINRAGPWPVDGHLQRRRHRAHPPARRPRRAGMASYVAQSRWPPRPAASGWRRRQAALVEVMAPG